MRLVSNSTFLFQSRLRLIRWSPYASTGWRQQLTWVWGGPTHVPTHEEIGFLIFVSNVCSLTPRRVFLVLSMCSVWTVYFVNKLCTLVCVYFLEFYCSIKKLFLLVFIIITYYFFDIYFWCFLFYYIPNLISSFFNWPLFDFLLEYRCLFCSFDLHTQFIQQAFLQ